MYAVSAIYVGFGAVEKVGGWEGTDLHIFEQLGAGLAEVIPRHIISFELKLLSIKLISWLSWLRA
jgi:hypothetical protein